MLKRRWRKKIRKLEIEKKEKEKHGDSDIKEECRKGEKR